MVSQSGASHVVLAYSGGLDTSVAIRWIGETYHADVTCMLLDMGQGAKTIEEAVARAKKNGATGVRVVPAVKSFAYDFVAPAIRANALYEGAYPLATALSRPLIARELVTTAKSVGADAVAHGCTGKGNDQVRIDLGVQALGPDLKVIAPQRVWRPTREEAMDYAKEHGLEVPTTKKSPYSVDENLWGRSIESGILEDPTVRCPEEAFLWTIDPKKAPDRATQVTLGFEAGIPTTLNGSATSLPELVLKLNDMAGNAGVGRIDHVENRLVGIKSREIYEAPAAVTTLYAKHVLETLTLTREETHLKASLEQTFARYVYDGLWYHPAMSAVRAFVDTVQANVSGEVTLELFKGSIFPVSRTAPRSLYNPHLATYGKGDTFDHTAAEGFIKIWGLPQKTSALIRGPPE